MPPVNCPSEPTRSFTFIGKVISRALVLDNDRVENDWKDRSDREDDILYDKGRVLDLNL